MEKEKSKETELNGRKCACLPLCSFAVESLARTTVRAVLIGACLLIFWFLGEDVTSLVESVVRQNPI